MKSTGRPSIVTPSLAIAALLALSACNATAAATGTPAAPRPGATGSAAPGQPGGETTTTVPTPTVPPVTWVTTPSDDAEKVPVDTRVVARAEQGTLKKVSMTYRSKEGETVPAAGWLESGTWTAKDLLEPGVTYTLKLEATNRDGAATSVERTFRTVPLTLDDQIYVKVAPGDGSTVGVGMPVIVAFDLPVVDKATFEKHMKVTSKPAQEGSWYWLSSREAHWRPKTYWKAGTKVHVEANLNGIPAGGNRFGELSRVADFTIGRSVVAKVNLQTHQMVVNIDGKKVRTIPISAGKPGWDTRSGVKVIMEEFTDFTMKAASIGIDEGSEDWYEDIKVRRALRITHSGEFIHTAPWSVGAQGRANVSHGCTNVSPSNGEWIFNNFRRGDVVEYTGSSKPMTMGNGYADWNLSWDRYQAGSAL